MHERHSVVVVVSILFFSIIFVNPIFAQSPQCNGLDATHVGTENKDKISGTSGDDVIVGLGGDDVIYGKGGNDVICGGAGNDKLYGNSGNDILLGEKDSDKIYGGQGIDTCDSLASDKRVIGCETPFIGNIVSDASDDLIKKIEEMQNQINNMILGLVSWTDIQGIPESLADGDDDTLANISCDAEQILVFDGNFWVCNDALENIRIDTTCNGELINLAGLSHGASLSEIQKTLMPFGVSLSATSYGKDYSDTAIIYDSDISNGKDSDLEVGIGKLVIIPDKIDNPSDSPDGGEQIYSINPPRKIISFEIVDIESDDAGTATAFDENGDIIGKVKLPVTGDKDHKTVNMGYQAVSKLVIEYNTSGGIANLCFSENDDKPLDMLCEENQILVFNGNQWVCSDNSSAQKDTLSNLNCNVDEYAKWNGLEWQCESIKKESIPIPFHFSTVGVGRTEWVGTSSTVFNANESLKPEIIITTSGVIKNLIAKTTLPMEITPPEPESYSITLLKNSQVTELTCAITNGMQTCENTNSEIIVDIGDTIVLKVQASQGAPFAIIRSSILFTSQ